MGEKIIIRDSKKNPQVVVDKNYPFFEDIKNSLMPDDYRNKMDEISNLKDEIKESEIKSYYESIENPYIDFLGDKSLGKLYILEPIDLMIN